MDIASDLLGSHVPLDDEWSPMHFPTMPPEGPSLAQVLRERRACE